MNKLVDTRNNTYHQCIAEKTIDTNYCALSEEIKSSHKASKFKVGDRVKIIKDNNIFSKGNNKN